MKISMTIYEKVPPTRYELLLLKEEEKNVRTGFDILKNKEDIMVKEFFHAARELHNERKELNSSLKKAYVSLVDAQKIHGVIETRYLAAAVKPASPPTMTTKKVAGVLLPHVEFAPDKRNAFTRGYSPSASSRELEAAASSFESTLALAVSAGEKEASAKKLGREILKARRRSRALEDELLPGIRQEIHDIKGVMDMRARESFVRTKKVKAMIGTSPH